MSLGHDDSGQGTPMVLLHAFPLSRRMWQPQREALASVCRLITPDLPGFGDSDLVANPTVETMADAVAQLLDEKRISEPVILGGLSMGGYVTFAFARKYPDRLKKLILADTRAEPDDDTAKANRDKLIEFATNNPASAVIEQMMPKMVSAHTMTEHPEVVEVVKRLASVQQPTGIVAALRMLRERPDSRPTLASIRVPTLIIVGSEDALTPPALSESMAKQIAGAKLVTIANAGHLSNLEQPAAFNDAVKAFVRS